MYNGAFEIQQNYSNDKSNEHLLCKEESRSQKSSEGNAMPLDPTEIGLCGDHITFRMTKEQIEERLSELFANINEKRNHDLKLLTQMKQEIMTQAERSCERLERHMCHMHEAKGKELDDAVNKLLSVLDRIRALETELDSSKSSLNILCQDIHIPM